MGWTDPGKGEQWLLNRTTPGEMAPRASIFPKFVNPLDQFTDRSASQMTEKDKAVIERHNALKTLESLKFEFNPPLHPATRAGMKAPWNPLWGTGDTDTVFDGGRDGAKWRLGQLMGDISAPDAHKIEDDLRYGFRFLYNPTAISMDSVINDKIQIDASQDGDNAMYIGAGGMGTISMELFLNRIPDVTGDPDTTIDVWWQEELAMRGTMVDIDYLYRVANGIWTVEDSFTVPLVPTVPDTPKDSGSRSERSDRKRKPDPDKDPVQSIASRKTGDIGILIPTPTWLSIGTAMKYYGWLSSINYTHILFSRDMVPLLTRASITFQRVFRGTKEDFDTINASARTANFIRGDYFEPVIETTPGDDGTGTDGEGQYKAWPEDEKALLKDAPGPYEAHKNLIAGYRAIRELFPEIKVFGGYRAPDDYGDHPSGMALDVMMPHGCDGIDQDKPLGDKIANFFIQNHKRFGVYYMIWHQQIRNINNNDTAWRGMSDRGSCTANHMDHVHLAFNIYPNDAHWMGVGNYSPEVEKGTYWAETTSTDGSSLPALEGTPRQILDGIVAWAEKNCTWKDVPYTPNGDHDPDGSLHDGPGNVQWACDFGDKDYNGSVKSCHKLANALSDAYNLDWTWDAGIAEHNRNGYDVELIYGNFPNHGTHVHIGVKALNPNSRQWRRRLGDDGA